jgi:glycosyltransferase involved in cell wall biosynthesis
VAQEGADWVLAYESRQLMKLAEGLGISVGPEAWVNGISNQSVFHESQFTLLLHPFERHGNRLGFAYFHGRPGTPGFPEFDECYETLARRHEEIDRIQVTNRAMEEVVLGTGVAADKVHRIPIGIDVEAFRPRTAEARVRARNQLDLPESAFVVGSFQKDGVGWGEGLEPKLIKGPDSLVTVAERLRDRVPDLWFLLTGPSRGYVKAGLERAGIPYRHVFLPSVEAVAGAYDAIDLCVVASREEGGPKAVLESMAVGVPLVTTRVGQATDLVQHGSNGWMVDPEDVDGLVEWSARVAGAPAGELESVREAGLVTARENSYESLRPRWRGLLEGFVAIPGSPLG